MTLLLSGQGGISSPICLDCKAHFFLSRLTSLKASQEFKYIMLLLIFLLPLCQYPGFIGLWYILLNNHFFSNFPCFIPKHIYSDCLSCQIGSFSSPLVQCLLSSCRMTQVFSGHWQARLTIKSWEQFTAFPFFSLLISAHSLLWVLFTWIPLWWSQCYLSGSQVNVKIE